MLAWTSLASVWRHQLGPPDALRPETLGVFDHDCNVDHPCPALNYSDGRRVGHISASSGRESAGVQLGMSMGFSGVHACSCPNIREDNRFDC